jgi:hypothetical protein
MFSIGDIVGSVVKAVLPAVIEAESPRTDKPMHQADTAQSTSGTSSSMASFVPPGGLHPVADSRIQNRDHRHQVPSRPVERDHRSTLG